MPSETRKKFISLRDAANLCVYSQDYLSLRARQGKLRAVKIGRNWVTTEAWLFEYAKRINEYQNSINGNGAREPLEQTGIAAPPANLPVFAPDADALEDNRPEEIARQMVFQRKLQFAFATLLVALLFLANIVVGQPQLTRVAERVSPVAASYAELGQEVWEAGFTVGGRHIALADTVRGYFNWLGRPFQRIAMVFQTEYGAQYETASEPEAAAELPRGDILKGAVVFPVAPGRDTEEFEGLKKYVRQSFSDEVVLTPHDDESGVITPVFRERTGDDYLYILVPIQENF